MDIAEMKAKMALLFEQGADIHVTVHSKRPKINIDEAPARIVGVYKNLFTVEATENGLKKTFTVPYTDVFIGKVKIKEL